MSGDDRLGGDFRVERGHVETSLEQITKTMDGMKLHRRQDSMRDLVMQSEDRKEQLEGLRFFRRMLCEEHNPHVQQIINMGLVPHFVQALRADDCPELQVEAAWALTNVSAGTTEETSVVVEVGGMNVLVELMKSKKNVLREQAIWAVGNIAAEGKFRDSLIDSKALNRLLEILTKDPVELSTRRIGTWALANFVRQRLRALDPEIKSEEFFQVVVIAKNLLKDEDKEIVLDAAWAISSLSGWGTVAIDCLLDAGVLECLLKLLEGETSDQVLIPILKTLSTIAGSVLRHVELLLSHKKLLHSVRHLLDLPHSSRVVYNTLWLVNNIADRNYKQVRDLLNAMILPKLVRFVKRGTCDQKQVAGPALAHIFVTQDMPHSAWGWLISEDEIGALCEMLTWNGKSYIQRAINALSTALYAANRYFQTGKEQCFLNESYAIAANVSLRKKRIRVRDKEREGQPAQKANVVAEFIRSQDGYFTLYHLQDHDDVGISEAASSILTKYFQDEILDGPDMNDENESDQILDEGFDIAEEDNAEDMSDVCLTLSKTKLQDSRIKTTSPAI